MVLLYALKRATIAALIALVVFSGLFYGFFAACVVLLWAATNYPTTVAIVVTLAVLVGSAASGALFCDRVPND